MFFLLHLSPCIPSDASELAQVHIAVFMPTPLHAAIGDKWPVELLKQSTDTAFRDGIWAATKNERAPKEQPSSR